MRQHKLLILNGLGVMISTCRKELKKFYSFVAGVKKNILYTHQLLENKLKIISNLPSVANNISMSGIKQFLDHGEVRKFHFTKGQTGTLKEKKMVDGREEEGLVKMGIYSYGNQNIPIQTTTVMSENTVLLLKNPLEDFFIPAKSFTTLMGIDKTII